MSTPETTADSEEVTKPSLKRKLYRWVSIISGVILLLVGLVRVYGVIFPSLPGCASDTASDTVRAIFKNKAVELNGLTNQKTVDDGKSEKSCQADFTTPAEAGSLSYRIYWKDRDVEVQITKVDARPR